MRYRGLLLLVIILGAILVAGCSSSTTPALSDAEKDTAFKAKALTMTQEISPLLKDYAAKGKALDYPGLQTASTALSTRARFWHDTLDAMPVSTGMEDSKRLMLLSLEEAESTGDTTVTALQRRKSGDISGATARMQEAGQHATKSGSYMKLAKDKLPTG